MNGALGLLAAALALAPRLLEGQAALQWTRYHAARATAGRPAEHARQAGRAAVTSLERLAPLPGCGRAARVALDLARRLEPRDHAIALGLAAEVRGGLERIRLSRLRGLGLTRLAEEARELEDTLREESQR